MEKERLNMEGKRKDLLILGLIPATLVMCLIIKAIVQQIVVVNTSIRLCDVFWLNYTQHICEYLDLQYGVEAIGRILVLAYMMLVLLLVMLSERKWKKSTVAINTLYIAVILIANQMSRGTAMENLIVFIVELVLLNLVYLHEGLCKHLQKDYVKVVLALYIGGSLGNIVEMNLVGWVTDYLYFLPAYGFKATSNLEDWITWGAQGFFTVYVSIYFAINVVKGFQILKSNRKMKRQV